MEPNQKKTKIDAIVAMPEPKDKKAVQRYLGMLNYRQAPEICPPMFRHLRHPSRF